MKSTCSKRDFFVLTGCILFAVANICSVGKMGRENAKRIICASNIKQILDGLTKNAQDNSGKLPSYEGGWLWDLPRTTITNMMNSMGINTELSCETQQEWIQRGGDMPAPDVFYCPSDIPHKKARQKFWDYHHVSGGFSSYRVLGYFFLFNNSTGNRSKLPLPPGAEPWNWVSSISVTNPDKTELLTDITMSDIDAYVSSDYPNGNFAKIITGSAQGAYTGCLDSTSHLKTEKEPYGGNIGFVDGHVEWRPFEKMIRRYKSGPVFWW